MTDKMVVYNETKGFIPSTDVEGEGDIRALMAEELDGIEFQFDRIKMPAGGGLSFDLPEGSEPPATTALEGVIVDHHKANVLWLERPEESGGGKPPDCFSADGVTAFGLRGTLPNGHTETVPAEHSCATCPWNQFGSGVDAKGNPTRGKRCKNVHRIYLMPQGGVFPWLLTLPPTSLSSFHNYLAKRIVAKRMGSHEVVTRITLKREQGSGVAYSVALFTPIARLSPEERAAAAKFKETVKNVTRKIPPTTDDYRDETSAHSPSSRGDFDDAPQFDEEEVDV